MAHGAHRAQEKVLEGSGGHTPAGVLQEAHGEVGEDVTVVVGVFAAAHGIHHLPLHA